MLCETSLLQIILCKIALNHFENKQSTRKLVETCTFALKGPSDILLTWKEENYKAFSPPSPPCNVVPLFELRIENNKHPNFVWRGGGGVWILLFSEVTLFEYNVSIILSPIVGCSEWIHFFSVAVWLRHETS